MGAVGRDIFRAGGLNECGNGRPDCRQARRSSGPIVFLPHLAPGAGGAGEGNHVMSCRCRLLACPALQGPDVPHQPLARPSMGCPGPDEPDIGANRPEMNRPYGLLRVSEKWNWMMFNAE